MDVGWILRSPQLFDEPSERNAARAYLADPANVFLAATVKGKGAGFLRGTALGQLHTRRRQLILYEIAVLPEFQRQGVARGLIEALLRFSRHRRYEEIFVFTSPNNRPAVRLCRTTGAVTETEADRMFVYRLAGGATSSAPRRAPSSVARPRSSRPDLPRGSSAPLRP